MESAKICQVCYLEYDAKDRVPRCLPCGHILCPKCLTTILDDRNLRKCPFDKIAFGRSQKSLTSFPVSYAIKDILEQKDNNICKAHSDEPIEYYCLTDRTSLCFECTRQEEHHGHKIKRIKTLKTKGAKAKEKLQETLLNVENYEKEKDDDFEQTRKVFISTIDEKVKEVKNILVEKRFEWVQLANNIFNANKKQDSEGLLAVKQQIDETVQDITNACQVENGDLIILNRDLQDHQNIAEKQTQFLKGKSSKVQCKFLEIQKYLKDCLENCKIAIDSVQFSTCEIFREIYSVQEDKDQLTEEELAKRYQKLHSLKFKSHYDIQIGSGCLNLSFKYPQPKELEINLADFQEIEAVDIQSIRCDMLKNEPHPDVLSYIFNGLQKLVELNVSFDPQGFNNEGLRWLGNKVQSHVHHLTKIDFDLENCEFNNDTMSTLCDMFFSKATNLASFSLDIDSCGILDTDIEILAQAMKTAHRKLKVFDIALNDTTITNDKVCQVFEVVRTMEELKELSLFLNNINIRNKSFKIFGENVLPSLKCLDDLFFSVDSSELSDESFCTILKNLPNLKKLKLYLDSASVTDKSIAMFVGEVFPRLKSLEYLAFKAKGAKITKDNLKKIKEICASLKEKRKRLTGGDISSESESSSDEESSPYE